jgi:uncharacterized protein YbjT (DUF2867 family)
MHTRMPDEFLVLDLGDYVLRRIEPGDAAAYDRYRADPEVTRYTSIDAAREPAAPVFPMMQAAFEEKRAIASSGGNVPVTSHG